MGSSVNIWKLCLFQRKHFSVSQYNILPSRLLGTSTSNFATEKVETEISPVDDALEDLRKPELSEQEILQKRFKARLPERIYRKHILKEPVPIESKYDYQRYRLRGYYARFGQESKLNPGICWPTREEMLETMKYDEIFEPSLQERIQNVESKILEEEKRKKEVEDEVDKNMANLDKWISDYYAKIERKEKKTEELKQQRERLVEEISEYLGYDIDPRDPRFKEAVEQRDKEKKKAMKLKKQQESYDKMIEKLRKIAESK
ncbi:Growth arrest and DNA damage-inducible like protein [Argiope bruennichi]|uniref:Large ribosomal subunit protein mL64 n=1 Tax=Argiope bruennichi TaxID=94029 RepID=A0A8T0FZP0_ARGBR|nr:Growth arrest and DNA damage-inducible like protein [Argiope bruennichi]